MHTTSRGVVTLFDRSFKSGTGSMALMGSGSIGGKAQGLAAMSDLLEHEISQQFASVVRVNIPTLVVIGTDYFDLFLRQNNLHETAFSDSRDDLLGHAFQRTDLPPQLVGDLRALIAQSHAPLAVRSSRCSSMSR